MNEIRVYPAQQHETDELLVHFERRRTILTSDRYLVHDGRRCSELAGGRRALACLSLQGVLVDADGRLIIDTDESGMVAAVLVMAAAIEKVESWVAERDAAQLGEPPPLLVSDRDIFAAEQHAAVYISPAIGAFGRASR